MIKSCAFIFVLFATTLIASSAEPTTKPAHQDDPVIALFLQPAPDAPGDSELRIKLKERHNTAVRLHELRLQEHKRGVSPLSLVFDTARIVLETKLDLVERMENRVEVVRETLEIARIIEASQLKQFQAGFGSEADMQRAKLARITMELELLK